MPDYPQLKASLEAHKEEKDGATFYRLVDPASGREYRLYEIEYLIAIMLDGKTPVDTVAGRVRDELKFDLSPSDLERFVRELGALGFLFTRESAPSTFAQDFNADDIVADADAVGGVERMAVEDELDRLVRSALIHIKQGMVGQGRDYFLAAKKYAPSDDKVGTMLNHLDVVGDDDGPSDIEYLWKQAVVQYPILTQEIGPPGVGNAPIPVDDGRAELVGRSKKRALLLVASLVVVGGLGFVGWQMFGKELLHPTVAVETDRVRQQRAHLYFAAEVVEISPKNQWSLAFEKKGEICEINVKADGVVKKGAVLARMRLPADREKSLAAARQKRQGAERAYLEVSTELEVLDQQKQQVDKDADAVKAQLDEIQKQLVLKTVADRAALKKEQGAIKKRQSSLRKDSAALRKRMAVPQKLQAKLKKSLEQAQAGEQAVMQKDSWAFLLAPEDAVVQKVSAQLRDQADAGAVAMTLADTSEYRLKLKSDDAALREKGRTKLKLLCGDNVLVDARVVQNDDKGVVVEVTDAEGALRGKEKKTMKLVRETIERALIVSAGARADDSSGYVMEKDYAVRRKIEWAAVQGKEAIARSGLRAGEVMVTSPRDLLDSHDERVRVHLLTETAEAQQQ